MQYSTAQTRREGATVWPEVKGVSKLPDERPRVMKLAVGGNRKNAAPCQRASVGIIRLITVEIDCTVAADEGFRSCTTNSMMLNIGAATNSSSAIAPLTTVGNSELPSVVIPSSASIPKSTRPIAARAPSGQ